MPSYIVNEIFSSINGEGTLSGELAIFIRLTGCNLNCIYCDTVYAKHQNDGTLYTLEEIIQKIKTFKGIRNITLTGGEPLFRKDINYLLEALTANGYLVNIETNGSILLDSFINTQYSKQLIFCCDYKLPYSNEESKMKVKNLELLRDNDVLKFVIGSKQDLDKIFELLNNYNIKSYIYLSAVFNQITPKEIVERLLTWAPLINTSKIRVQLQLHKYIWDPSCKGV